MFFLKKEGLGVAMHSQKQKDDRTRRNRISLFVINPPIDKGFVGVDIKALFGR